MVVLVLFTFMYFLLHAFCFVAINDTMPRGIDSQSSTFRSIHYFTFLDIRIITTLTGHMKNLLYQGDIFHLFLRSLLQISKTYQRQTRGSACAHHRALP